MKTQDITIVQLTEGIINIEGEMSPGDAVRFAVNTVIGKTEENPEGRGPEVFATSSRMRTLEVEPGKCSFNITPAQAEKLKACQGALTYTLFNISKGKVLQSGRITSPLTPLHMSGEGNEEH
jgi:hypothetical protein